MSVQPCGAFTYLSPSVHFALFFAPLLGWGANDSAGLLRFVIGFGCACQVLGAAFFAGPFRFLHGLAISFFLRCAALRSRFFSFPRSYPFFLGLPN